MKHFKLLCFRNGDIKIFEDNGNRDFENIYGIAFAMESIEAENIKEAEEKYRIKLKKLLK